MSNELPSFIKTPLKRLCFLIFSITTPLSLLIFALHRDDCGFSDWDNCGFCQTVVYLFLGPCFTYWIVLGLIPAIKWVRTGKIK